MSENDNQYIIQKETLTGIANAVRHIRQEKEAMTPAQIEAKIRASQLGIPVTFSTHINPDTGEWERPSDWPDLDALAATVAEDEDCLYLTYDLRKTPGYGWIGILCTNTIDVSYTVERGHIENGLYVADASTDVGSNVAFRESLDSENGDVQVWRVRSEGQIEQFGFIANSSTNSQNYQNNYQPCIEIAGRLPYVTSLISNATTSATERCIGTVWLERFSAIPGKYSVVTSMQRTFYNCYSLQSLDFSGWDTSNWKVQSLNETFYNCYSLQSLDFSGWDTSNWSITTLAACFQYCYSLQSLDLSKWDTSNWKVTALSYCFAYCHSLKSIDWSGWDTSNWSVTSLAYCFQNCYSLQVLNFSGWNTYNWSVGTLTYCFAYCHSLQSLDLSKWKTGNWAVTNLSYCFQSCYSLRSIDFSGWDTYKWSITNISYVFSNCYSLRSLDVSVWTTSKWKIVNTNVMFGNCKALTSLVVPPSLGVNSSTTSNVSGHCPNLPLIQHFNGVVVYINHAYSSAPFLTPDSLRNILAALPTVTAKRTITLGQVNKLKLTAEEIAVATQKGWTVA